MNLVYYLPTKNDAPAKVGKSIIEHLDSKEASLEKINVMGGTKNTKEEIKYGKKNYEEIGLLDFLLYQKKCVVHIPISPNVFPNKKFILHILAIIKKKKLIVHFHGNLREYLISRWHHEKKIDLLLLPSFLLMGPLLRRTSCVVTHSYTLKACLETTYNLTNVCVIPNAVDDLWFESDNNSFDRNNSLLDENSFKIFYHGRLSPEKGVDLLIETLSIYSKMNPKSVLYIAGDGPFKTYLRGLSKKLNVEKHVVFLGVLSASEIKHCLKEADIAIYPSRFDNFPLAMLEAFACAECPVVLSSNSGICDFIRKDGYYFETINPNKSEILKSILNANQLNENIKYQKQFAQKYKWKYIMHKYIALYRYIEKN